MPDSAGLKKTVVEFWDQQSCGETYLEGNTDRERFETQAKTRYELEPYIRDFAKFEQGRDKDVL